MSMLVRCSLAPHAFQVRNDRINDLVLTSLGVNTTMVSSGARLLVASWPCPFHLCVANNTV